MLNDLRKEIDAIDEQLIDLLQQRLACSQKVAIEKEKHGLAICDQEREADIFRQVKERVKNELFADLLCSFFQSVISGSKALQQTVPAVAFPYQKVGIIGLGLMGGALARYLHGKDPSIQIFGYDPQEAKRELSLYTCSSLDALLEKRCHLLIIATPISTVIDLAKTLVPLVTAPTVLWDIASVKQKIHQAFEQLSSPNVECIATHPIAGGTGKGSTFSSSAIFPSRPWVLCPHMNNSQEGLTKAKQAIAFFGSKAICMTPDEHDQLMAYISHLPKLLSHSLLEVAKEVPYASEVYGRGFEVMTELGKGNFELIQDIMQTNKKELWNAIGAFTNHLETYFTK